MRNLLWGAVLGIFTLSAQHASAQACGGIYTVRSGDSLSVIADRNYKKASLWTAIHNANISTIGKEPNAIRIGMKLSLTCIDGLPVGLEGGRIVTAASATPSIVQVTPGTAAVRKRINLLTGSDYAPFTDREGHNGGLLTEVVQNAMDKAAPKEGFAIHWVNDWSAHLEPLLSNALLDLGFPWFQPDCAATPDAYRCANFYFSDPMFEMLALLFTAKDRPMAFNTDADIIGKTLCRPAGYYTHDMDKDGRNWVRDGKIKLEQPAAINTCFDMLLEGKVDAVALNEFTGRAKIKELDLADKVDVVARPLSIEGLHVVVHKSHPRADELLTTINNGLRGIKDDGKYQAIIEDHMARIWADF